MVLIPTADGSSNLIILTGRQENRSLYEDVQMALQAMDAPEEVSEIWLPQFTTT